MIQSAHARACFLRACELDVAVRKPGNVSRASPGHGMHAELFTASAHAAAAPLFEPGARVGRRIEAAVQASWAVAGCNTNLGIVLLCAPVALAVEAEDAAPTIERGIGNASVSAPALQRAIERVLADLDLADAQAAYRAIARAHPGGLGTVAAQDVHGTPSIDLRRAMALAAPRDRIARLYRDGYAALFDVAAAALGSGFSLVEHGSAVAPAAASVAAVQRLYLALLARWSDSHIVRIHGEAVAQTVMSAAQAWQARAEAGAVLDAEPGFAAWDTFLKAQRINPGTTADLTVTALLIAGLGAPR